MANEDVLKGKVKQVEGRVQKAAGDLTGNTNQKIKGTAKDVEGKLQEGYGRLKEGVRDAEKTESKAQGEALSSSNEPATPG